MPSEDDNIQNLPIDIAFSRLGEWLIDRKRIPADWRKRLAAVRGRISSAVAALDKGSDPYFQTLDPEGLEFLVPFDFDSVRIFRPNYDVYVVVGRISSSQTQGVRRARYL